MGGTNESVLKSDKKSTDEKVVGDLLKADVASVAKEATIPLFSGLPTQTQSIRQHMSNGQIHLHVDAEKLKVAIPVAEWFLVMRNLRSLNPFTFIDSENNCVAYLRPYIYGGSFEIAIEIAPIAIGPRFNSMNAVTGKR